MTGNDAVEKVIKLVITTDHAIVMDNIREETLQKDHQLQNLAARIQMGDWNKHRRDPDISCFYEARHELFVVDDLIHRIKKTVIPTSLQRKVIKAAHHLGHLGMTKRKQMLREKYWFPSMNGMVEQIIGQCYDHKAAQTRANQGYRHSKETMGCHNHRFWWTLS